jgi:uncharacterized Tic20 family protein
MQEERNSGAPTGPTEPMSAQEETTWSVVAHLSALAGLVGLMPFGALLVWLLYKDRSPRVRFHALQALWYQVAWIVIWVVASVLGLILTIVTLGFGLILVLPAALLLWLAPMAHGCYAAYRVNQGEEYRYPFIADKVDGGSRRVL